MPAEPYGGVSFVCARVFCIGVAFLGTAEKPSCDRYVFGTFGGSEGSVATTDGNESLLVTTDSKESLFVSIGSTESLLVITRSKESLLVTAPRGPTRWTA